eukprot:Skav206046  [mRNA]  locus=scaffold587:199128:206053:+ [translate_table: standard]
MSWLIFLLFTSLAELELRMDELVGWGIHCWCELGVYFCNHLHGGLWQWADDKATKAQLEMMGQIRRGVERVLEEESEVELRPKDIKDELSKKTISYTGEELSRPEELSLDQVIPGLPPKEHGGSIPVTDWVDGRCRYYLENPSECLLEEFEEPLPKLQGKIHMRKEDQLGFASMLVDRRICRWIRSDTVLRIKGREVLNGMFGVRKPHKFVDDDPAKPILRLIMNLVPSNAVHRMIGGRTHELPHITRWCNILVEEQEILQVCQSDMTAAFYLFQLPTCWSSHLAFNIKAMGKDLGMSEEEHQTSFTLACSVLPMGWSSAVGVMQYIAEEVLYREGVPRERQLRKTNPLPIWMLDTMTTAKKEKRLWWHVYLDNYASGEKVKDCKGMGEGLQAKVEKAWRTAGIVVAEGKSTVDATNATELGAFIGGKGGWMGASPDRLLRVARTTLWLLRQRSLPKKLLQVIMGRWIFILQFRRPAMSHFEKVWEFIAGKVTGPQEEMKVREELLGCLCGVLLFHTFLGAKYEDQVTCSDASGSGGAVAVSSSLSSRGVSFLCSQERTNLPQRIPVAVISLFNGIGGAFRCYDLAGLAVAGGVSVECHKPANRVCSRRWPWVMQYLDIREFAGKEIEEALEAMGTFEEIHLWCGFPCTDLSSAKANRLNLRGRQSSLFYEAIRVEKEVRRLYPSRPLKRIYENVASMDIEARNEISAQLQLTPFKLDPSFQVPMSRPRLCWTDVAVFEVAGVSLDFSSSSYTSLIVTDEWPCNKSWLQEGAVQWDKDTIFPTCMKAIRRHQPPPQPAGLRRCDPQTIQRWESDNYKFPPYQYKSPYLITDAQGYGRLLNANEREQLMGFGKGHTSVCYSASEAKANRTAFEDERESLVGDSFSCYSFMIIAAFAGYKWTKALSISQMHQRTGLAPGASTHVSVACPLSSQKGYGEFETGTKTAYALNIFLAQRANHTVQIIQLMKVRDGDGARKLRAQKRKGVALEDRAITAKTRVRYFLAVRAVLPMLECCPKALDEALSQWIEEQYADGEGITRIGDTLSGLHHFAPWMRGTLQGAWKLFRLWRKVERPQQAPPLPESFAEAFVARCLEADDINMAAALSIGFWGLLRTGEILSLYPHQILVGHQDVILQLGLTKTGLRRFQDENVVIHHEPTRLLLSTFLSIRKSTSTFLLPIVPGGGPRFRSGFASLLEFFALRTKFRPYSLRRGGATAYFRRCSSMEATLIKGRDLSSEGSKVELVKRLAAHQAAARTVRLLGDGQWWRING